MSREQELICANILLEADNKGLTELVQELKEKLRVQQQRIEDLEVALRETDGEMVELAREVDKSERLFVHDADHVHAANTSLLSPSEAK